MLKKDGKMKERKLTSHILQWQGFIEKAHDSTFGLDLEISRGQRT